MFGENDPRENQTLKISDILQHPDLAPDAPDGGAATNSTAQEFYKSQTAQEPTPAEATPAAPPAAPTPTPQAAPPEPPPAPAPAPAPQSPSGRLIAGKYRSVEEAERGILELNKVLRERNDENLSLKAKALAYETVEKMGGFRPQRPEPAPEQPTFIPVQFTAENQPVVPLDEIEKRVEARSQKIAQQTVQSILTPLTQLNEATSAMKESYPEFVNAERAFSAWLKERPDYIERITRDPQFALEAAYLKFTRDAGAAIASDAVQATQAAQQQVDAARAQAAPAGGTAPASRRPTESDNYQAKLKDAIDYARRTGDKRPYKNLVAAKLVGAQFLDSLDKTDWGTR